MVYARFSSIIAHFIFALWVGSDQPTQKNKTNRKQKRRERKKNKIK